MAEKKISLEDLILINRNGQARKAEVRELPVNLPLEATSSPVGGDIYYNQGKNILYVYNGAHSKWEPQGVAYGASQPPTAQSTPGALWYDTTEDKLKYFDADNNVWSLVGANKLGELLDVDPGAKDLQLLQYDEGSAVWKNVDVKDVIADVDLEDLGNISGTAADDSFISYQGDEWVIRAVATDTGDLQANYSTVKIDGETIKVNDDGQIFASIDGALTFKGTVDCVYNQYNEGLSAPDYNNAVVGDLYVHADLDASTDPAGDEPHGSWNLGVSTVVIGDLLVKTGSNDWAVIGRVVDDVSGFVQKAGDTMTGDLTVDSDIRVSNGGSTVHELKNDGTASFVSGDILFSSALSNFYSSLAIDPDKITFSHGQTAYEAVVDADVINLGFLKDKFGLDPDDPDAALFVRKTGDTMSGDLTIGTGITLQTDGTVTFGNTGTFESSVVVNNGNIEALNGFMLAKSESGYASPGVTVIGDNSWITKGHVEDLIKNVTGIKDPSSPDFDNGYYVLKSGDSIDIGATIVLGRDAKVGREAVTYQQMDAAISGIVTTLVELDDTNISDPVNPGQALIYNGTKWINDDIPAAVDKLDDLSDVTISSSSTTDDFLVKSGAQFVNIKPPIVGSSPLKDGVGFVRVEDEYTDSGTTLKTNISATTEGILYSTLELPSALEFRTTIDTTFENPPGDAAMGEIFVQLFPPKNLKPLATWAGIAQQEVEGGEMITGAEPDGNGRPQKWYIIGKLANDDFDSFVKKHGDTMTGSLVVADTTGSDIFVTLKNSFGVETKNLEVKENATIGTACTNTLVVTATSTFNCPVTFEDLVTINDNLVVTGDVTVGGELALNGTISGGGISGDLGNITIGADGEITISGKPIIGTGCTDELTIKATTTVECPITFENDVTFGGDLIIDGNLTLTGDLTLDGNLITTGKHTHNGELEVTGDITATGDLGLTGNITVDGTASITGDVTLGTDCDSSTLTVKSKSQFECEATFTDDGKTVTIKEGGLDIEVDLGVHGQTSLGDLTAVGDVVLGSGAGSITIDGVTQINDSVTIGAGCDDTKLLDVQYPTVLGCDTTIKGELTLEKKVTLPELIIGETKDCSVVGLKVNTKSEFECEARHNANIVVNAANIDVIDDDGSKYIQVVSSSASTTNSTIESNKISTTGDLAVNGNTVLGIDGGAGTVLVYGDSDFKSAVTISGTANNRARYVDNAGADQVVAFDDLLDAELLQKKAAADYIKNEIDGIVVTTTLVDLDDTTGVGTETGDVVTYIGSNVYQIGPMHLATETKIGGVKIATTNAAGENTNISIDGDGFISSTLPNALVFIGSITSDDLLGAPSADPKFVLTGTLKVGDFFVYAGKTAGDVDYDNGSGSSDVTPLRDASGDVTAEWYNLPTTIRVGDLVVRGEEQWSFLGNTNGVDLSGYVEKIGDTMSGALTINVDPAASALDIKGVSALFTTAIGGTLTVTGASTLNSTLGVSGAATLSDALSVIWC